MWRPSRSWLRMEVTQRIQLLSRQKLMHPLPVVVIVEQQWREWRC